MKNQINIKFATIFLIILFAIVWRIFFAFGHSPMANFTPIGTIALFGGYYLKDSVKSFLLPILSIWLSDLVLNYFVYFNKWVWFYDGFGYTYGSFVLMIILGRLMTKVSFFTTFISAVSAALLHWVITDFGVWFEGKLYPKTWEGLVLCYYMAIPYLKTQIISNLIFGAVMFGGFELIQQKLKFNLLHLNEKKQK